MSEERTPRLALREIKVEQIVDVYRLGIDESSSGQVEAYGRGFVNEAKPQFERKICATCADCKHQQGQSEAYRDHMRGQVVARAVMGCSKAQMGSDGVMKIRTMDPYCPDGFNVRTRMWVDPATLRANTAAFIGEEPVSAAINSTFVAEQDTPFDDELQNHLTKPELEAVTRQKVNDMLAVHGSGGTTVKACRDYLEGEKKARREDFFGPGGQVNGSASTPTIKWPDSYSADEFNKEYMQNPLANDPQFMNNGNTRTIPQREALLRDVPQGPDVGTW